VGKKKWRYGFAWLALTREPIQGVRGHSPQWGPGASPLVRDQGAKPPEADDISASLDYICKVNFTPEFLIMGAYLNLSGVP